MTEDEMIGWHHRLSGHEFEKTTGDGEGQGSLACCSLWVTKSQTQLSNWTTQVRPTHQEWKSARQSQQQGWFQVRPCRYRVRVSELTGAPGTYKILRPQRN